MRTQSVGSVNYSQKSPAFGKMYYEELPTLLSMGSKTMFAIAENKRIQKYAEKWDIVIRPSSDGFATLSISPRNLILKFIRSLFNVDPHINLDLNKDAETAKKVKKLVPFSLKKIACGYDGFYRATKQPIVPKPKMTTRLAAVIREFQDTIKQK